MDRLRDRLALPGMVVIMTVGLTLGGLLIGYEPVGGDPDRLYRPIKSELARSLAEGSLPFWSDRFGLGVPLVAESHVAAFYPPNWILYGALDVSAAYRLSMWLHYVALAGATYLYARRLGVLPWGAALASLAFCLCGFQAIHSSHEPLYSTLPFLPFALYLAERYLANHGKTWLALVAIAFGAQLTLGHFQIAMWTAGLVLVTGVWRVLAAGDSPWRIIGLAFALTCGVGIAAPQLILSWDYAQLVGSTSRTPEELMFYAYPAAHWSELAFPRLFQSLPGGPEDPYWLTLGTTGYEASLYIGTLPLILTCVGLVAQQDRALRPWRVIVPLSFALATMPGWWPTGYQALLQLPGLGYFRAPGRYTLITAFGLALLAGRGFDCALTKARFRDGVVLALLFGLAGAAWAGFRVHLTQHGARLGELSLSSIFGWAAVAWLVSLFALLAWRRHVVGPIVPFMVAAIELGVLFYQGTTVWGWSIDLPNRSPVLSRLAKETIEGTVAGDLHDLPVRVGRSPTYPYLGMGMLPPTSALGSSRYGESTIDPLAGRLLTRLGTTHGVWTEPIRGPGIEVLYAGADDALDRVVSKPRGAPDRQTWYLVRYPQVPPVHVTLRTRDAPDVRTVLAYLAQDASTETAWFLPGDRPVDPPGPRASGARVVWWDGLSGEIDHDGTCDIVIRRTYAPGWTVRIDNGPELPVGRVNGGLQHVRLSGVGPTRFTVGYKPPRLGFALSVSVALLAAVLSVIVFGRRTEQRQ